MQKLRIYNNPGSATVELSHGDDCYVFGWDLREEYDDFGELVDEYIDYTPVFLNGEFYLPYHVSSGFFPGGWDGITGKVTYDELLNALIGLKSALITANFKDCFDIFLDSLGDQLKVLDLTE